MFLSDTDDLNLLLQHYCSGLAQQASVSSPKIDVHCKVHECGHEHTSEQLATSFQSDFCTHQENKEVLWSLFVFFLFILPGMG